MKSFTHFHCTLVCSIPFLLTPSLSAQQIVWGGVGSSTLGVPVVQSDGSPITLAEFSIEFGAFTSGFTPTTSNIDQWVSNWNVFDAITDPDSDPSDGFVPNPGGSSGSAFVGQATLRGGSPLILQNSSDSEDADPNFAFAPGSQGYVFIRNADTTGVGSEFLLYTSENNLGSGDNIWAFPTAGGSQQTTGSLVWGIEDTDTVIFGGANGITGAGEFTDTGVPVIRTHTFVPEPSTSLFVLLGGLLVLRRRR